MSNPPNTGRVALQNPNRTPVRPLNNNGAAAQLPNNNNALAVQLNLMEQQATRLSAIEQRLHFSQRSGADLLIRVAQEKKEAERGKEGEKVDKKYFEDFLGQIVGGKYTKPGNLDWWQLKRWVVLHVNKAVRQKTATYDEVGTNIFMLNTWEQGRAEPREFIDKVAFIRLLIQWEKGEVTLPTTNGDHPQVYIEFESTKLEQGIRPSVESPGSPEQDELEDPINDPPRRPRRPQRLLDPPRSSEGAQTSSSSAATSARAPTPVRDGLERGGRGGGRRRRPPGQRQRAGGEKSPSPDAEADEADENNDLLNELEKRIPGRDVNLKADNKEHWDKVKTFFKNHDEKEMQFSLPGLLYPIEGYQAAAVVWMLTRIPEDGVAGAMLADAMGLGKTFTIIATLMSYFYVHAAYEEVQQDWDLREKHPGRCPCLPNSTSRAIAENMANFPSIIVCPSAGATVWVSEWEKFVRADQENTPAARLKLYVHMSDYKGGKADFNAFCQDMEAAQLDAVQGVLDGGSGNVLLVTRENITKWQHSKEPGTRGAFFSDANQLDPHVEMGDVVRIAQVPVAGCGIFAMDEMHQYKGHSGKDGLTNPFRLLYKFKYQETPTLAVGISGNTMSIGPEGWHHLVEHTRRSLQQHSRLATTAKLGRLQSLEEYKRMKDDWNHVLGKMGSGGPNEPPDEGLEECKRRIHADFQQGIIKMIVRRAKDATFNKVPVLDILAAETTPMPLRIPESPALADMSDNVTRIHQWVRNQYDQDIRNCNAQGSKGAEPPSIAARTQNGLLQGGIQDGRGKGAQESRDAYHRSVRAMTFPEVARIGRAPGTDHLKPYMVPQGTDKKTGPLAKLAKEFTNATLNPERTRRSVRDMIKKSPFWQHRGAFRTTSPKFERLCQLVEEQLINTRADIKDGPPDGSGLRHMVVFTENPLSAYLTALFLQGYYRKRRVHVTLIHMSLPDRSSSEKHGWNCRFQACQNFNKGCDRGDDNKILVGTYRLISTMINFQRASSAVLMDVPTTVQSQQARDRIHRRGQPLTALITEMYYENHIYEATRWRKNQGKELMERIDWTNFQSAEGSGQAAGGGPALEVDEDDDVDDEENIYD
ncbi:superfamily II DNA/RNA helicase [Apiospora saccharicola]|uniref:Superfamily II DNA/RNA helicase n=1 Tax=Apiospora saccharicola TaxID=335842 RepID=A0ABR1VB60_9PEZI